MLLFVSILRNPGDTDHLLLLMVPHRNNQPALDCQLADQLLRHDRGSRCDNNSIIRRIGRPAERSVAQFDLQPVPEIAEQVPGLQIELLMALHAVDLCTHLTEHRRLVAGTSADFKNLVTRSHSQKLSLGGHCIGLGDRLSFSDGKGGVLISPVLQSGVHKEMTGYRFDGVQYLFILDTPVLQELHQLLPPIDELSIGSAAVYQNISSVLDRKSVV